MQRNTKIKLCLALALGVCAGAVAQQVGLSLIINGNVASSDVRMIGGRAYAPLSDVARALNMTMAKKPGGFEMVAEGGAGQIGNSHTGKIGDELFTGSYRFKVINVKEVSEYAQQHDQDRVNVTPKGSGDVLIVVDCRVKNGTKQKQELVLSPSEYGENTALTDDQEHSYQPYKYDAHYDEGSPAGAFLLPGSAVDFAIVFSVPKGTKPKDLVFTLVNYRERGSKKGTDVRVSLAQ